MWWTTAQRKFKPRLPLLGSIIILTLGLLIVTQVNIVQAALARNVGALYLIDDSTPDNLDRSQDWLTYSASLSRDSFTCRLVGKQMQERGDIVGAMNQWRDASLISFAVDVGLQELVRADEREAQVWQQEILATISKPAEWQRLGAAFEFRKDYTLALDAYQQALALLAAGKDDEEQISRSEIYYSLARIREAQFNDIPKAIEAYSDAVEFDDFDSSWHRVISYQQLAVLLMKQDNRRAVFAAQRAVELMPESTMGHSILGLVLYATYGDLGRAEQEIRLAIDLDPQSAWSWMHLGQLYAQAGKYELAVDAYLQAAQLNPALKEAHDMAAFLRVTYLKE